METGGSLADTALLLMSGMARAADQFDFSINEDPDAVTGNVNHQGNVVLHGPWCGVTWVF